MVAVPSLKYYYKSEICSHGMQNLIFPSFVRKRRVEKHIASKHFIPCPFVRSVSLPEP